MKISVNAMGNRVIELECDDVALVLGRGDRNHAVQAGGPVVYLGLNPKFERILQRQAKGILSENIVYMKSLHALSADMRFRESITDIGLKSIRLEKVVVN